MEALRKIKIDQHVMVGGPIQFDSKGQNVNIKATAVENLKRKPTVVLPLEFGGRAARLPDAAVERQAPHLIRRVSQSAGSLASRGMTPSSMSAQCADANTVSSRAK